MFTSKTAHSYPLRSLTPGQEEEAIEYTIKDHGIDDFLNNASRKKIFFPTHQIISKEKYVSDMRFKAHVQKSLNLLRSNAPEYYSFFAQLNKTIRASNTSGANRTNNSIDIGPRYFETSNAFLASMIIHETVHFWQYEKGYIEQLSDQDSELEALKYQLNVLKLLDASKDEIQHIQKQRGTHTKVYRYSPW